MLVDVIIPALDEALSISAVVRAVARLPVREVIVVDNGSSDATAQIAREAGARVVTEPRRGYGAACLAGIAALAKDAEVVVFLDADGSDDPRLVPDLVEPIASDVADLVVGSRRTTAEERAALTPAQRIGNGLAASWLRARFGIAATDLGPLRAVRLDRLRGLGLADRDYGFTVEMQIKAARAGLRYREIPVPYRRRSAGASKVSGTLRGTAGAAFKILGLLAWHDLIRPRISS